MNKQRLEPRGLFREDRLRSGRVMTPWALMLLQQMQQGHDEGCGDEQAEQTDEEQAEGRDAIFTRKLLTGIPTQR